MKRKKVTVAIIVLVVFALAVFFITRSESTEVIHHDYTFSGEDTHWKATYHVKGKEVFYEKNNVIEHRDNYGSTLRLEYKGDLSDLKNLEELRYAFITPYRHLKSTEHFDKPLGKKVFIEKDRNIRSYISPDDKVFVSVVWDARIEKFTLTFKGGTKPE